MSHNAAEEICRTATALDLNEADTRFHIIDRILSDVLGWPRSAFTLEQSTADGYSDYHLLRPNGTIALIVEAKRSGIYFDLPANFNHSKPFRSVKAKALMTSPTLKSAMTQAQRYCTEEGCEFAAVTNGAQFVLFKAFERNKSWRDLTALVVSDITWFRDEYSTATALLGYTSVIDRHSLRIAFDNPHADGREVFFSKENINSFNQQINSNFLAPVIRTLVQRYFGPIDVADSQFVERCYVNQRAHDKSLRGIRTLIQDSVSPFMESYGVVDTEDADSGGALASRLARSVRLDKTSGDVIILFGGKGVGKSTFIRKVLLHRPPQYLRKHSVAIIVDALSAPKDSISVRNHIWGTLVSKLDTSDILNADRDELLKLFSDRFEVAKRQDLKGFFEDSHSYNEKLNALIALWKSDLHYVAHRLVDWHARHHRGVIVVVDNTDQLETELQDYAFSLAVEISKEFRCVVLISMREERFYASKIRGMLDAYQNSAFHISSPSPEEVFEQRIQFVLELLRTGRYSIEEQWKKDVEKFFRIFQSDFNLKPPSPLNRFISASAQGNIRLALDLFGDLVLSGYTNATEMVNTTSGWTIQIHQVLRPLLTPTRLFYDEKLSKVPNLFQIRTPEGGSHFTGLRILRHLTIGQVPSSPAYISFAEVRSFFGEIFAADKEFCLWVDRLLASNLIEASTRHDVFSDNIDSIRVTSFGQFVISELYKIFTYIELTATDCGIRDESVCNELARLSNAEVQLLNDRKRFERVKCRIEKAEIFMNYLSREEERELELFSLGTEYSFIPDMMRAWKDEKPRVLHSARRNQ